MRLIAACCALASAGAWGASLEVIVRDANGAAVDDAVVYATPKIPPRADRVPRGAEVAQKDRQFAPRVTVVQAGAAVRFPNRDPFRHHVYSFSPAKIFEIKLYVGTPADPVLFDKAGEIVLGCNIHDDMVGYVYVVDTPHYAKTDDAGRARLESIPDGDYALNVWHFAQATRAAARPVTLKAEEARRVDFAVTLKATPPRPATN